jgi:hypothetical protein
MFGRWYGENTYFYKAGELSRPQENFLRRPMQNKISPVEYSLYEASVFERSNRNSASYIYALDDVDCKRTNEGASNIENFGCFGKTSPSYDDNSVFNDINSEASKLRKINRDMINNLYAKKILVAGGGMGGTLEDRNRHRKIDMNLPGMKILGLGWGDSTKMRTNPSCNTSLTNSVIKSLDCTSSVPEAGVERYFESDSINYHRGIRGGVQMSSNRESLDRCTVAAPKGGQKASYGSNYHSYGAGGCISDYTGSGISGNGIDGRVEVYCTNIFIPEQ